MNLSAYEICFDIILNSCFMKQWTLLILNTATLLFTLLVNYLVGANNLTGASVGEISDKYDNLFTPAGYAFAIWGVIYFLLVVFVIYQWVAWIKQRDDEYLNRTGIWFILSNLANAAWIIVWTSDMIGLSLVLIIFLFISLLVLVFRLRLEVWDAPVRIIAFVWWPVCIYIGWIVAASLANFASYTVSINPENGIALQPGWAIFMIVAALLIYVLFIYFRNMREAAIVGVWALIAIAVKQFDVAVSVSYVAITASVILLVYISIQANKNKNTSPFYKLKRGEF